jgi:hypothetical protein
MINNFEAYKQSGLIKDFDVQALTMWIQNNPDYATINTWKVNGIAFILNSSYR